MKLLILASSLLLSFSSLAKDNKFSERKAKALAGVEKRITTLNNLKSCISSASDKDALKSCRKSHKESMKSFREENKASREERRAQREARKAQKNSN